MRCLQGKTLGVTLAAIIGSGGDLIAQRTPDAVVNTVRAHASAAGFEGTILIGERNGTSRIITVGASPVGANAVWRWASITKQLAAVLAMQEVARGRLDLDAPVSRYWPEWTAPNAATIRIRDLMLHNSGLRAVDETSDDPDFVPAFYGRSASAPSVSAAGFCAGPARAAAPANFEYNDCDTIVLGEVLARITGQSFEALLRERIATPLGMQRFGLYTIGNRPRTHVRPSGGFVAVDTVTDLGAYGAAGSAYGTISDLWRFDRALLAGRLLPDRERSVMWTGRPENGYSGFFQWIFEAALQGCSGEERIVERRGLIGGIEHRNLLLPQTGQAVIMFGRRRPLEYGEIWEGKGLTFDVLSAVACQRGASTRAAGASQQE